MEKLEARRKHCRVEPEGDAVPKGLVTSASDEEDAVSLDVDKDATHNASGVNQVQCVNGLGPQVATTIVITNQTCVLRSRSQEGQSNN